MMKLYGLLAALAVLGGCGEPSQAPVAANLVNAAAPAGAAAANETEALGPAEPLLGNIPVYPNADGQGVRVAGRSPDGGGVHSFRTSDSAGRVADFYASAAERAGFEITDRTNLGGGTTGITARRNGALLNVSATRVGAVTEVQVMASAGIR